MESTYTVKLQLDMSGLNSSLRNIQRSLQDIGKIDIDVSRANRSLSSLSSGLSSIKNIVTGLGIASVFNAASNAIKSATNNMFDFANASDSAQRSFEIMLGHTGAATALTQELKIFSQESAFSFQGATAAAKQLLAYGFQLGDIMPSMTIFGDAAAAMGGNIEDSFSRIARAMGQIQAKQKVSAEELMQLAEVGIPAYEILREKLGLTSEQVANIGREGISATEAINALSEGMSERFGGAMENMSNTVPILLNNIKEGIASLSAGMFNPLYESFRQVLINIKSGITIMQEAFNAFGAGGVIDLFGSWSPLIREVIAGFMTLGTSFSYLWTAIEPVLQVMGYFVAQIGSIVIPVISSLITAIGTLINWFTSLVSSFSWVQVAAQKVVAAFTAIKNAIFSLFGIKSKSVVPAIPKPTIASTADYAKQLQGVNKSLSNVGEEADKGSKKASKAVKKLGKDTEKALGGLASFDEVFTLQEKSTKGSSGSGGASGGAGAGGIGDMGDLGEMALPGFDTSSLEQSTETVKASVDGMVQAINTTMSKIGEIFNNFPLTIGAALGAGASILLGFNPIVGAFAGMFITLYATMEDFRNTMNGIFSHIGNSLSNFVNGTAIPAGQYLISGFIFPIITEFETLKDFFAGIFTILGTLFAGFVDIVLNTFSSIWGIIQPILDIIKSVAIDTIGAIRDTWNEYGAGIVEGVINFTSGIIDTWNQVLGFLTSMIKPFLDSLKSWWDSTGKGIVKNFLGFVSSLMDAALSIWNNVINPIIQYLLTQLKPIWDSFWKGAAKVLEGVASIIGGVISSLLKIFEGLMQFISGVFSGNWSKAWDGIKKMFEGVVGGIKTFIQNIWDYFKSWGDWIGGVFKSLWDTAWTNIKNRFDKFKQSIDSVINLIKQGFQAFMDNIVGPIMTKWNEGWNKAQTKFNSFKAQIDATVTVIKGIFNGIVNFISGGFKSAWDKGWNGIVNRFSSIFNGLKAKAKGPINGIIDTMNDMISKVNNFKIPEWVPMVGGKGLSIPKIPRLATGGLVTKQMTAMLGEGNRKEAILPLQDPAAMALIGQYIAGPIAKTLGEVFSGGLQMQSQMLANNNRSYGQDAYVERQGNTINAFVASEVALQELYRKLVLIAQKENQRVYGVNPGINIF